MPLATVPAARVRAAVAPPKYTETTLLVVPVLALVGAPIGKGVDPLTVHLLHLPLAHVLSAIAPEVIPMAMNHVVHELAIVHCAILPYKDTHATLVPSLELALVARAVRP